MYYQASILLCQSFKKDMYIKFGRKNEILYNHWVIWPLITWAYGKKERYITTFTKTTIPKLVWNTFANKMIPFLNVTWFITTRFLYLYMLFLYVKWSRTLLRPHSSTSKKTITSKLGGNKYKNEMIAYLHTTRPNHAKVIKATVPKVALMKGIYLIYILYDILTNEKSIYNFYKTC